MLNRKQKYLHLIPLGGLSNRTRAIASALIACDVHDLVLILSWQIDEYMGATYEELYSTEINQDISLLENLDSCQFYLDTNIDPGILADENVQVIEVKTWSRFIFDPDADVFGEKFNFLLHKYLNYLIPVKHIQDKAHEICRSFDEHTIGVHIRSGLGEAIFYEHADISLDLFSAKINKLASENAQANFYVATDSLAALAYIEQNTNTHIKTLEDHLDIVPSTRLDNSLSVQTALIEILALSQTKHILGSYYSNFSEYASLLGNIKLEALRYFRSELPSGEKSPQLWGLVTLFNPCGYNGLSDNLEKFLTSVRAQGLNVMLLEIAFDEQKYVGQHYAVDKLVQFRSDTVLWHKERLFNLALGHLPDDCEAVCWLDADILF